MPIKIRTRLKGLKARFWKNMQRTSPWLIAKLILAITVFLPWLVFSMMLTWAKMLKWRKVKTCKEFLKRHSLAFEGLDPATLEVESKSGGLSNANQIWRLKNQKGEIVQFFVKVFVAAGSFWAHHLSIVSPFPRIYGGQTHERFTVDMVSRVQLAEEHIPVPKLVAFDPVEKVMVIEFLSGESVDDVLKGIAERGRLEGHDGEVIRQCGSGLAKVHRAGFSLIDTQPVNCIWKESEKKVYFTDLEFCTREDKRIWDVGFFLCFLALRLPEEAKREAREIFISGYQSERELNLVGVSETGRQLKEYLPVFQTILDLRQFTPEELFEELVSDS